MDLSECHGCLCFAARRAARAVTQRYDRALKGTGLRATQFTLLVVLSSREEPTPLGAVAAVMGMERTTLTRNLSTLIDRGYIVDSAGDDRRVRKLAITQKGKQAALKALPQWRKAQAELLAKLPPGARETLEALA